MHEIANIALVGSELAVAWGDGTESYLSPETLRRACPCASCRGEPDALGRVVRPNVSFQEGSFVLTRFEQVGGYAIQIHFGDGHHTGIYSFDYLRRLADEPGSET